MKNDDYQIGHDACGVGFITQLKGQASHEIVARALQALTRLAHRGGVDADGRSGDGAGLLMSIPDAFLRQRAKQQGIELPPVFGLGMAFLAKGQEAEARAAIEGAAQRTGLRVLGWSVVPTNLKVVGPRAMDTLPTIEQCFVAAEAAVADMEAQLFRMRKEAESCYPQGTYFCSLSSRTVVYKGLLTPSQLPVFYPDLADPSFQSTFAIFHQRYSTNTAPSWSLAQPFRFVGHNGEINTISGNRRWLRARAAGLREKMDLPEHVQLLEARVSDSASFDNGLEIYLRNGYSPMEAMLSMVPPAWEAEPRIVPELRHFLDEQSKTQEPWDGPAAMIFSDGVMVGAKLDRNGLRPMRYTLTADGLLIVGSEVGIADLKDKQVIERQRLGPGEILLANPATGELLRPKDSLQLKQGMRTIVSEPATLVGSSEATSIEPGPTDKKVLASMGWSEDQFKLLFQPLVEQGQEAVWSMGDDAPPAALSRLPRPLWDYCKQRFAQVTNPPIDSLREGHLMSLRIYLGDSVVLGSPLLDAGQLAALEGMLEDVQRISATYSVEGGVDSALKAIERVQEEAAGAATRKPAFVLLSDRGVDAQNAPLPSLLATAAVWKAMMQAGACEIPLIVETGQVIDTHHVALLIAAGASAVLPYLAMEQAATLRSDGPSRYRKALEKGLRKVISRMGISTIASYRNSQLFETIGLDKELCEQFFEDAHNSLGGKSLTELLGNALARHTRAYTDEREMLDLGLYRFRQNGEQHGASPELVRRMHRYIKSPTDEHYRAYAELANTRVPVALRDLLELPQGEPVPLEGVEEESSVLSRFSTQAMSLGAISPETHTTLAIAMNRLGARSNTGEGGEDPEVYREGSEANNRVKQIASGRFGVTADYLVHADELEIKMAQGAKPGEGGQLPAMKVTVHIARLRHAVPNMMLISPPPHHDIYSIEDLAQLIYDLRAINPQARIGVKLVSGAGVGIIAMGVAKAGADVITIAGHDGGTGASPITSIKNTGLPWEIGLRDAHKALVRAGLRGRVRLRVDGGFKFGRDVIIGALFGADEYGFGTSALLAIGCVMARQCHLNTCPVGIATQDEKLRARFTGKPEMVETYFHGVAQEVRELLAAMGARSLDEIIGAAERLRPKNEEAKRSLGDLLNPIESLGGTANLLEDKGKLYLHLVRTVDELETVTQHRHRFKITNADRAIGAHLSGELIRRIGAPALAAPINYQFTGYAGQSFGAFLMKGLRFRLIGEANDYVGKGMSGGVISITAGKEASLRGDVIAGNTVLYGATSGELYVAGRAGERFAVRNSGALAVVEGVGHHGCEYMTSGIVVILGPAGMNLGAGMTGGLAYLLRDSVGGHGYNHQSVRLAQLEVKEELWLRQVLRKHHRLTDSPIAARLLDSDLPLPFLRVEPLQPPVTVAQTWAPVREKQKRAELPKFEKRPVLPRPGQAIA